MTSLNLKVHIDESAYRKIMYWMKKAGNYEVSGLGNVVYDAESRTLRVTDAYLLEQTNGGVETDITANSIGKLEHWHFKNKIKGSLNFWWHSHVNMEVFWSKTDQDTIKQLGEGGWFLSTVFNLHEEMRSAVYLTDPMPLFADELPTTILVKANEDELNKALSKLGFKVKDGGFGSVLWNIESVLKKEQEEELDKEYDSKVTVKTYAPRIGHFSGRQFSHTPLNDGDDEFQGLGFMPGRPRDTDETHGDDTGVPDYVSRPKFNSLEEMDEDEMDELMEDLQSTLITYPDITREDLVDLFIGEYPFVEQVVPKNLETFRGTN